MSRLLRHEARLLWRQPALWVVTTFYLGLLVYGAMNSVVRVRGTTEQVAAAVADVDRRWSALRAAADAPSGTWASWTSPSLVGGPTGYAVTWMALDGLAVLSPGESGRKATIRRISLYGGEPEPPLENPLTLAGGVFDLAFAVIWLLPLTVIVAGHAAVSGDRQTGTWPLVAATTSAPGRVLAARLVLPSVVLTCATLMVAAIAVLAAGGPSTAAGWFQMAAWGSAVLGYVAFWTMAAGIATMRSATAPVALTGLGLLWMGIVWIVPGLVDATVAAGAPLPNRLEAHVAARDVQRDLEQRLPLMVESVYAEHPEWRPSANAVAAATRPVPGGPASRDTRRVYVPARAAARAVAPMAETVARRSADLEQLVRRASVLSPSLAMQAASDHLAGTSATRFTAFEAHVVTAERAWHGFFERRIMQLQDLSRDDLDWVPLPPPFERARPATETGWPAAGLIVFLLLSTVGYRRSLQRLAR